MLYTLPKEVDYNPLLPDLPKEGWRYSMHAHKNKNGIHYDLLLSPPNQIIAYSWSTKTVPFKNTETKAFRTRDKLKEDLTFNGMFLNRIGYNRKKLLVNDNIKSVLVDEGGINLNTKDGNFRIEHVKGKKYIIKGLDG